jgi:hypothetical protein
VVVSHDFAFIGFFVALAEDIFLFLGQVRAGLNAGFKTNLL